MPIAEIVAVAVIVAGAGAYLVWYYVSPSRRARKARCDGDYAHCAQFKSEIDCLDPALRQTKKG
jgi:hypothetical protein